MPRVLEFHGERAESGGPGAMRYAALVERLRPLMEQPTQECCAKPENWQTVGRYIHQEEGGKARVHPVLQCEVCNRVRIPAE